MLFGRKKEIAHAETTVHARAKINLTLDVTGQREDGYHTVQMVMQSVALHDEVKVTVTHGEKKPRGIILTCDLPYLPVEERNLAYRTADAKDNAGEDTAFSCRNDGKKHTSFM